VRRLAVLSALGLAILAFAACSAFAEGVVPGSFEESFAFREAFLPPGVPSVALRNDETSMLWNPAGIGFQKTYYVGYSWKGTYHEKQRYVSSHFFLSKGNSFAFGYANDDYKESNRSRFLATLAPSWSRFFSVGVTGKWNGGFNYDLGAIIMPVRRMSIGLVARDVRDTPEARHYYEGGLGIAAVPSKFIVFFDVIYEDSKWRKATAWGGGFLSRPWQWFEISMSYFDDGTGRGVYRATAGLPLSRIIQSEYAQTTDDWNTRSIRLSTRH
jgi:opacity protein-like surface antigen